jgi:Putative lumazine-binding
MATSKYRTEYDEIAKTTQMYIDGSKQGKSALMRPTFHPDASFFGYAGDQLAAGTPFLFDCVLADLMAEHVAFVEISAIANRKPATKINTRQSGMDGFGKRCVPGSLRFRSWAEP